MLKVPEYYLNMDAETIANYCFHAKSQNEKNLTREYINIYYNRNQPQTVQKSNLKLSSRKFFGSASQISRDRTYSDNVSNTLPSLETQARSQLKNSDSNDKLKKEVKQNNRIERNLSTKVDDTIVRTAEAKRMIERAPECEFREVPSHKKSINNSNKKSKRNRRKHRKVCGYISKILDKRFP